MNSYELLVYFLQLICGIVIIMIIGYHVIEAIKKGLIIRRLRKNWMIHFKGL